MNEEKKIMLKKMADVYRMHSEAMLTLIPVVESFDGKVFNKRLETAMTNALPDGQYVKLYAEYGSLKISVNINACCECGNHYYYPANQREVYYVGRREAVFTTTPAGKWRINSAPIVERMKEAADYYAKQADEFDKVRLEADNILTEMRKRVQEINQYQNQFDSLALDILGAYVSINKAF